MAIYVYNATYSESVGVNNIVHICINNVLSMLNVANLLIYCFPSLYLQGWITHCLEFLLEDWGNKHG